MTNRILVTGSEGLIGTALTRALRKIGWMVLQFDLLRQAGPADVLDNEKLLKAVQGCSGVVHLAAVSRVVWGERDPTRCWRVNVGGTCNVLRAAVQSRPPPWVIFASSREVYGQPHSLPARENEPIRPINIYGRSKAEAEMLVLRARSEGLHCAILRLSSVYGSTADHADRVVPAFVRAAVLGDPLRVDGANHIFDFVHVDDALRGIMAALQVLDAGEGDLPPIHLVTGTPTTLGDLARRVREAGDSCSEIYESTPRSYDVARFYGDPARARQLLSWVPRINIRDGVQRLVQDFRVRLVETKSVSTAYEISTP